MILTTIIKDKGNIKKIVVEKDKGTPERVDYAISLLMRNIYFIIIEAVNKGASMSTDSDETIITIKDPINLKKEIPNIDFIVESTLTILRLESAIYGVKGRISYLEYKEDLEKNIQEDKE